MYDMTFFKFQFWIRIFSFSYVILFLHCNIYYNHHRIDNESSKYQHENAVLQLLIRLLGPIKANYFSIRIVEDLHDQELFKIYTVNESLVHISATTVSAATYGLHYYLKNYCKCHISWDADQLNFPSRLPFVNITVKSESSLRYYQNVCTASYSFVWWNWSRWEREIDWMALNGINLALAFTGQEIIWKRVYKKFNLTNSDIDEHFTGPPFLSWGRMGNIRKWGGPLNNTWHLQSLLLQHLILNRMRSLGIKPILPCFSGHIPHAFKRLYPNASMTLLTKWCNFPTEYCCPYVLDPLDPLFKKIGTTFMQEMIAEFGTDHVYQCHTFNEMMPIITDNDYLKNVSHSIFSTMAEIDSAAIWILQGWIFVDQPTFWTREKASALLSGVPNDRLIILDLQSEQYPQYVRLEMYFGKAFIWCMLHNFGGTLGMHGSTDIINERVIKARSLVNSTMIGIGITAEGINQNYVIYDLMLEMAWRKSSITDINNWFSEYSERRYCVNNTKLKTAWNYLKRSIYNYKWLFNLRGQYTFCVRPRLDLNPWIWYNVNDILLSWDLFLNSTTSSALSNNSNFKHDIVDITRQVLQLIFDHSYKNLIKTYNNEDLKGFQMNSKILQSVLIDLELILSTDQHFLLGVWLENAKAVGTTASEKELYEQNARNQITLWGPNGEILDYATKQWSGIIIDYYYPRWDLFLHYLTQCLTLKIKFDQTAFDTDVFNTIEKPFMFSNKLYPINPVNDSVNVAMYIHKKWRYQLLT